MLWGTQLDTELTQNVPNTFSSASQKQKKFVTKEDPWGALERAQQLTLHFRGHKSSVWVDENASSFFTDMLVYHVPIFHIMNDICQNTFYPWVSIK